MENLKIIIFGCSKRVKDILKAIKNIDEVNIIGYVDNDEKKWGTWFYNKRVFSLKEALSIYRKDESVNFLIAPQNFVSIEKQLREFGVDRIFIHLYELLDSLNLIKEDIEIDQTKNTLLVSYGGLPKDDNRYRSGFVHRRILAYKNKGLDIVSYGYIGQMGISKYEYDGNLVFEGDGYGLSYLLSHGNYNKILIHFPTEEMLYYIEKYIDNTCKVFIWIHGFEILKWKRRSFNYSNQYISDNIDQLNYKDKAKEEFFKRIFLNKNFHFIFVSKWLRDIVAEDMGLLPKNNKVIPNYIDSELFTYESKEESDATRVLLIKSNKTRMYANDIAAKALEYLANRECFDKMEFDIYGDGELFEDNYKKLIKKNYPNVHIYKKFLTQIEIAQLHKTHGIFLCPTRQDTQGVSMCEAMSSGLVVITNKVAAIPEYINEESGILCDYEDYKEMADALEMLYYHRDIFLQYSKSAASFIRKKCGFDKTIQLELDLICEK